MPNPRAILQASRNKNADLHINSGCYLIFLGIRPSGFEPLAFGSGDQRSIRAELRARIRFKTLSDLENRRKANCSAFCPCLAQFWLPARHLLVPFPSQVRADGHQVRELTVI